MVHKKPIGIFDSGYGGLTVFKEIKALLPDYDYLYLGDNIRAPYGNRSYKTVYRYTLECVKWFFKQECPLVVLACNTASAKSLRTIQQRDLRKINPDNRVLGVIRPTAEVVGKYSKTRVVAVLGTQGTVDSYSYEIEIKKFFPDIKVIQQACPMWVPIIENGNYESPGVDYFIELYLNEVLAKNDQIDTLVLACTHYPVLVDKIQSLLPEGIKIITQGSIISHSLENYLIRHPEMDSRISKNGLMTFCTTDDTLDFDNHAPKFFGAPIQSEKVALNI